jgi:catechol 2,3-dioxygenase-like lactoylglutathione lyase family enzyme
MTRSLSQPRWTHVALPVSDLDRSIEFYTTLTPLVVVARHADESGRGAWLSNDQQVETPFVLVLSEQAGERAGRTLGPFAHLGIELPHKEDVDAVADQARAMGVLHWEPQQLAEHVGYVCAAVDPDGNVVEFSWNQKVYEAVQELWGATRSRS